MMEIWNRKDLEEFHNRFDKGEIHLDAVLMADIDLGHSGTRVMKADPNELTWFKCGYEGCFDGNGHTISGIYLHNYNYCRNDVGFFAAIGKGGVVKNLTVEGQIIGDNNVGGIAGGVYGGQIINCVNKAKCEGEFNIGGICGYLENGRIDNCINYGDIDAYDYSGGIVGMETGDSDESNIHGCENRGELIINDLPPIDKIANKQYRYDQIGGLPRTDGTNKEAGDVRLPVPGSLFGSYLKFDSFSGPFDEIERHVMGFMSQEPDLEYTTEKGETFLHLLCQNEDAMSNPDNSIDVADIAAILAAETKIDFAAKDKSGHEAIDYLEHNRFTEPLMRVIEYVKSDRDRLEYDTSFSEVGF